MTTSQALTPHDFQKQIYGLREALVKMCLSQESEQAYTVSEVDSFLHLLTSSRAKKKKINPSGYSLKMLRDFYQVAEDEIISTISLSWTKQGMTSNGKCSTQKITEFPKTENASILSDILEAGVDDKYYLSAETGTKHGLNVSGLVFDEIHAQPNRHLYDVLTKGSGDAREQPLFFIITTAGTVKNSICYELHTKALDILKGRKKDTSFYPVVYGLSDEDDWNDEANWLKANPSLGHTIGIDRVREAYQQALDNPAEENVFKQLRLNMWTSSHVAWIPEHVYAKGNAPIDYEALKGRDCYAGLDLSSTSDITAFVLVFPPRHSEENYIILPFFWLPEDTLELRCRRDHVLYDVWKRQGYIKTTEGNVVHYGFIEAFIEQLSETYHIKEIAYDRWNATQMVQNLEGIGLTMVPFGQGYKDMSPPSKELYKLMMEGKIQHGGHPVLKWMGQNVVMRQDPAGNIKPDKEKSVEKIDGIVALIMGLDRCIRHQDDETSVYDERGLLSF